MSAVTSFAADEIGFGGFATGLPASISTVFERLLQTLAPDADSFTDEPAADSQWVPRLVTGFIEAVPYRRGALAMTPDAARGLLDLQARDPRSARRVLDRLNEMSRSAATRQNGELSIVDETLLVTHSSTTGPSIVVTHLA